MSIRLRLIVAVAAACLGAPLATAHAADPAPLAQAHPSTKIIGGQQVLLTWSGLTAGPLDIRECSRTATTLRQCETTVRATGTGPAGALTVPVSSGTVAPGLVCDAAHPCSLAIVPSGQSDLAGVTRAPVHFSAGHVCASGAGALAGSGSPSADATVRSALPTACLETADTVSWQATESPLDAFAAGQSDFAVTETPLAAPPKGSTISYAPLSLSAVVLAYDLHDTATGKRITDLRLTPDQLARIETGQASWSDPAIAALNPSHTLPDSTTPLVRSDPTWAAFALSSWLSHVAPSTWTTGARQTLKAAPDGAVADSTSTLVTALGTDGTIGLLDRATAVGAGLPMLTLVGAAGDVPADDVALVKSFSAMTTGADGLRTPSWTVLDHGGWPLPDLAQVVAPTTGPRATSALGGLLVHLDHHVTTPLPTAARAELGTLGQRLQAIAAPIDDSLGAGSHQATALPFVDPPAPAALPALEVPSTTPSATVEAPIVAPPVVEDPSPSPAEITTTAPRPATLAIVPARSSQALPHPRLLLFVSTLLTLSAIVWMLGLWKPRRLLEPSPAIEVVPLTARQRWEALTAGKAPVDRQVLATRNIQQP